MQTERDVYVVHVNTVGNKVPCNHNLQLYRTSNKRTKRGENLWLFTYASWFFILPCFWLGNNGVPSFAIQCSVQIPAGMCPRKRSGKVAFLCEANSEKSSPLSLTMEKCEKRFLIRTVGTKWLCSLYVHKFLALYTYQVFGKAFWNWVLECQDLSCLWQCHFEFPLLVQAVLAIRPAPCPLAP